MIDFADWAHQKAYSSGVSPISDFIGRPTSHEAEGGEYGYHDVYMATDATIALLAALAILGISVKLAKIPHRTKRLVLGTEAAVVTLLLVAGFQLILWERPAELSKKLGESKGERQAAPYETTPHAEWPPEMTIAGDKSLHK